jgi:hypothetical protein
LQGARAPPMPPGTPRVRAGKQGRPNRLGVPPTAAHGCKVPPQRRPAPLTPPDRVPMVGTGAIRAHDAGPWLAQPLASPLPAACQAPPPPVTQLVTAPHNHAPLAPGRQLVSARWATACFCPYRAGFRPGRRHHGRGGLRPWADGAHTHGHAAPLLHRLRRRAFGQAIRPCIPRDRRLDAGTVGPPGAPGRPGRARARTAPRARPLMPWIRAHSWCARGNRADVRPPWGGLSAR